MVRSNVLLTSKSCRAVQSQRESEYNPQLMNVIKSSNVFALKNELDNSLATTVIKDAISCGEPSNYQVSPLPGRCFRRENSIVFKTWVCSTCPGPFTADAIETVPRGVIEVECWSVRGWTTRQLATIWMLQLDNLNSIWRKIESWTSKKSKCVFCICVWKCVKYLASVYLFPLDEKRKKWEGSVLRVTKCSMCDLEIATTQRYYLTNPSTFSSFWLLLLLL